MGTEYNGVTEELLETMIKKLVELEQEIEVLKRDSHPSKEFVCMKCGRKAKRVD